MRRVHRGVEVYGSRGQCVGEQSRHRSDALGRRHRVPRSMLRQTRWNTLLDVSSSSSRKTPASGARAAREVARDLAVESSVGQASGV
ncbi:hypothetical protein [Streptomyces sp. NPDC058086]|uniref:hypothetical protein n=1 Tax=Streptomyces sp. NPDC058086 TaxID=3346334 RepID=UPI0036ECCC0E